MMCRRATDQEIMKSEDLLFLEKGEINEPQATGGHASL